MRIDRLELKNFRGFEHLELELDPRFTLLIGGNGSGKTNVLEGLAVALSRALPDGANAAGDYRDRCRIERHDIRRLTVVHHGAATLEPQFPVSIVVDGRVDAEPERWTWLVPNEQESSVMDLGSADGAKMVPVVEIEPYAYEPWVQFRTRGSDGGPPRFPLVTYFGTDRNRAIGGDDSYGNRDEATLGSRTRGYREAVSSKASHLLFESWMAWRTEVMLQRLSELIKRGSMPTEVPSDPLLDAIQAATCCCVDGAQRFFYDINHQELRLELESGELIPFSQLSDGYRNLVAMVADIAWRAMQLNPHLGADAPRQTEGVVLIDELELHLHPAWQRKVIDNLLGAFPKLQFVATTHSPQVIASARPESMWLLHDGKAIRPGPIHGKDSNAILRDIMGVSERPGWMSERLDELARLIEDGNTAAAKSLLAKIQSDLGDDDPTVTSLQWELHDLEVHGAPDPQAKGA